MIYLSIYFDYLKCEMLTFDWLQQSKMEERIEDAIHVLLTHAGNPVNQGAMPPCHQQPMPGQDHHAQPQPPPHSSTGGALIPGGHPHPPGGPPPPMRYPPQQPPHAGSGMTLPVTSMDHPAHMVSLSVYSELVYVVGA